MSLDIWLEETSPHTVFDANITHNLNRMADEAGIYHTLWHPEDEGGIATAKDLADILAPAIHDMKKRPEYYSKFDAPNGWGKYKDFIPWLEKLYAACLEHPNAIVKVSR